jgi:molybdopterin-guanine dinucleotide biosynthesis protein A
MSGTGVVGVLLAGGQSRRMGGGEKFLRPLGGRPILERVVERVRPQVSDLILNTGGDGARFQPLGLPVVADVIEGFAGPLAGILTGLEWAAANVPAAPWVASFATDAPFLPDDLVERLMAAVEDGGAEMACAVSRGRTHPVFALWPVDLRDALRRAMVEDEMRKIDRWTAAYRVAHVDFAGDPVDPFFNVNRPEDLAEAETLLAGLADTARGAA